MVVGLTPRQWRSLVAAVGISDACAQVEKLLGVDLRKEGDRFAARHVIGALVEPWVAGRTLSEIREVFDAHDVCWGPYQTFAEMVSTDPRCSTANPMFAEVDQPGIGTYLMPGSPLEFSVGRGCCQRRLRSLASTPMRYLPGSSACPVRKSGGCTTTSVVAGASTNSAGK